MNSFGRKIPGRSSNVVLPPFTKLLGSKLVKQGKIKRNWVKP